MFFAVQLVQAPASGTPQTRRRSVGSLLRALATDSRKNPRTRRTDANLSPRDRRTRRSLPTAANLLHMTMSPLAVPRSQPTPVAAEAKPASPQPSTSGSAPPQPVELGNERPQFAVPSLPPRVLAAARDISTPTQTFCEVSPWSTASRYERNLRSPSIMTSPPFQLCCLRRICISRGVSYPASVPVRLLLV